MASKKKTSRARKKPAPRRRAASNEQPEAVVIIEKEGDTITSVMTNVRGLKIVTVEYIEEDGDEGEANFRMGGLLAIRKIDKAKRANKEIVAAMLGEGEPLDEDEEWECLFCGETFDNEIDYDLHECPDEEDDEEDEDNEDG